MKRPDSGSIQDVSTLATRGERHGEGERIREADRARLSPKRSSRPCPRRRRHPPHPCIELVDATRVTAANRLHDKCLKNKHFHRPQTRSVRRATRLEDQDRREYLPFEGVPGNPALRGHRDGLMALSPSPPGRGAPPISVIEPGASCSPPSPIDPCTEDSDGFQVFAFLPRGATHHDGYLASRTQRTRNQGQLA